MVDGVTSQSFIGDLYDNKATYKGLYYFNGQPKYQGIYNNIGFAEEPEAFKFDSFKPEKIDVIKPLTDADKEKLIADAKLNGISELDAINPFKNKAAAKTT